ncbi:hypothetical protein BJY00DRAFT_272649 [Aspergillus carlsbadensis]|nr:hypothetical protein BJY00DRAFT_272649 [Aspergillus carlsbadensis]
MTITTYPATTDSSELAALNISRLLSRLGQNLLSPNADLKTLRRSEYQRMRVSANVEYARTNLQALERSLPQIKPVDRRHELQTTLTRNRQTLKQLQNILDDLQSDAEARSSARSTEWDDGYSDEDDAESEDLLGTPEGGSTTDEAAPEDDVLLSTPATTTIPIVPQPTATTTAEPSSTITPTTPAATILRNRHHNTSNPSSTPTKGTTATGTSLHPPASSPSATNSAETEQALSSDRAEQENLTSSLLSLATQLKTSSQAFQASLDAEKSVLARAAEGLDRTTGNLAAAERRMGMLRRMTEGKGWLGRMMLYAWIFALWVVAVLIVFVGPKLRF